MPLLGRLWKGAAGSKDQPRSGNGLPAVSSQGPAPAILLLCPWLPVTVSAPISPLTSHLTGGGEDLAEDPPPTWAPGPLPRAQDLPLQSLLPPGPSPMTPSLGPKQQVSAVTNTPLTGESTSRVRSGRASFRCLASGTGGGSGMVLNRPLLNYWVNDPPFPETGWLKLG